MAKTKADAEKQTAAMEGGKHHIGDFLPPEELNKFMNKYKVCSLNTECAHMLMTMIEMEKYIRTVYI